MNIVRYQRYPQNDLSVALDRLTNMRDELDRVFETSFGSFFRPLGSLNRWNPAVDVYQDNDQFTVYAELPGLKKEEIEISLNGDTLTIGGERKHEANADRRFPHRAILRQISAKPDSAGPGEYGKGERDIQGRNPKGRSAKSRRSETETDSGLSELIKQAPRF